LADLSRHPGNARVRLANIEQVVDPPGGTECLLAEGADVRVVVERDGDSEASFHLLRRADPAPAREDAIRL
jgi:hypothetical protein